MKYIVIWLILYCFHTVYCVTMHRSCKDVLNEKGTNATDGEYDIYLENRIGVKIYCHDFTSGQPKEFLTLKAERSSNFASYYDNVGSSEACADLFPQQNYSMRGRTEFTKLRLNPRLLVVDTNDYTFTKQIGPNKISYGRAGDKFSSSPLCEPMGTFSIDLSGTPFSLVPDTKWAWVGNYTRGNVIDGHATVKNQTYLGCWQNGPRAFRGPSTYDNTGMTQQACVKICRGYGIKLAGLQSGSLCHCPYNYDTIGPVSEASCDKPCAGDPNQICGGETTVSVYSTDVGQKFQGRCGGYPGYCFPTTSANPNKERLQLRIADGHKCFDSPCYHDGKCFAVGSNGYQCRCYVGYGGHNCFRTGEIYLPVNRTCPSYTFPEGCKCQQYSCPGASFEDNKCVTKPGYSTTLTCRPADSGQHVLTDVTGPFPLRCPRNTKMVNCAVSTNNDSTESYTAFGQGYITDNECNARCVRCVGQVRCKHTICNCGAHGHCNVITAQCECDLGYYGDSCDVFDYCSYYEDLNNVTACTNGGICRAVYKNTVKAYAGDKAGDTCIFPFDYKGLTYNSCVEDSTIGPPFACSGLFRKTSGYIDLGKWSPGSKYTIAAWVRPAGVDTIRRTVVGGVQDCNDFGFNLNSGTFRGFLKLSKECTRDLDAGKPMVSLGQWYMVAITNNATHAVIYQNGEYRDSNTVLMNHFPTTQGFRIGGEVCCPTDYFNGMIKTVKVWKRALSREEINRSMYNIGTSNSTTEALHDGLVGHWELADSSLPPCLGIDHEGSDWNIQDGQLLSGIHCNISRLFVPKGVTAIIQPYNGTAGGKVDITAKSMAIDGIITGTGAGYRGAPSNSLPGDGGYQGESYLGLGEIATSPNRGGGGGGKAYVSDGLAAGNGAGGGYGSRGDRQSILSLGYPCTFQTKPAGGEVYGDDDLSTLYLGSGGGSGGNAVDLSTNPKGGRGGNGGGAIKLTAVTSITVNGGIFVDGEAGEGDLIANMTRDLQSHGYYCPKACNLTGCKSDSNTSCWDVSGPGGGGSGGSIYLSAKYVRIGNRLSARGGIGGKGGLSFCGGNGGRGRIRIDSVVFSGRVPSVNGTLVKKNLTTLFLDHSQGGQKLIDLQHTRYGNEIYWGCFRQSPGLRNTLGYAVPLTTHIRRLMTPDYCMFRCREKGYTYSGTQNGQECYCDNHLLVEYKVHDSECNTSCDGDALQMCGGNSRLQVFGPPPSSPAPGYGVLSKCEPWCVTADPNTQNPKWGLCSAHKPVITDWNIQCECPAGKTGNLCDELCPRWTYGRACKNNCTCNETNTAYCEPNSGACQCKPGFQGLDCSLICTEGFFGQGCKSPCNCSNNAVCDPRSGTCRCRPGWTGLDCQFPCPKNKFGVDCNQTCACNHGSCAPEHGQCQCDPGYKLPFCYERCDPDTYGQDCEIPCDCNGQYCDSVTGLCLCFPGYIGNKCEIMCPHGSYGQGCQKRCPCQNGFGCDHQTGQCHCGRGFIGENCELQCPYGSYGSDCLQTCPCIKNQTSTCSVIDGACFCLPGFYGDNCEFHCTMGYHGEQCKKRCDCLHGAFCEATTGKCLCAPGFIGDRCDVPCPDGSYGDQCQSVCPTCNTGICSKVDGQCICKPNSTGVTCSTCPRGFSGPNCTTPDTCVNTRYPRNAVGDCVCEGGWMGPNCDQPCPPGKFGQGCLGFCRCVNGTCDPELGKCFCNEGFTGKKCNTPCKSGQYGRGCRFQCQRCGAHALPGCDIVTGNCLCSVGYTGPMCDRPCPQGTYGKNCSLLCSCNNGGLCDSVTGKCICQAGFTGTHCDLRCPAGSWGVGCNQTCNCGPHGTGCSPDEGLCICKAGFTGVKCRETCPVGTYGNNCTKPCHCDPYHGRCSPIDGSCLCDSGWTGNYCEQVCDRGFWGRGCTQKCQCNGRGTCSPFDGVCDCDVGYIGPACDQQCKQDIYWGDNCANKCDCRGGHCDHRTGKCTCPAGKIGHHCEKGCDSNHFGFLCAQACGCENNAKCDTITGFCACQPGWSGVFCTEPCPEGYYGVDCAQPCPLCLNGGECDTFIGLCNCPAGFTGPVCNTSAPGVLSSLTGKQTSSGSTGVVFTTGQLAGLIIGFVILVVLSVIITVIFMRKKYVGRFGNQSGAMQFQEEVEIKETQRPKSADVAATSTGFINPLNRNNEFDENFPDSRSEVSESTSGVASNVIESDDEDKSYFKDSAA